MQLVFGCIDGATYYGDKHSEAEIMEQIKADGYLFGTSISGNPIHAYTIEEVIDRTHDFIEMHNNWNTQTVSLIINGVERKFNARHIVWWEIRRDDD